ncbi:hypothetical protein TWF106_004679 [Orbilia oligospora]|uniref:PPM-type phosphatase domain-containing protein n=1 Tax=Orbilia oligospora TaxID=2813651 RepID=A0A6G1M425_ORBOL|nr:hypothetical protein TWF788_001030 [Orbilia oligospora]KAF3211338.1 hypothetical protein TWF679_006501 [Orbilia oligospora]KAF3224035.1 hypothetical protein TWF106_004679 [Orbilia oligospora]KAF3242242.1 hypothetical protein TWF192_008728 [Orbilia oligospora]
MPALNTPRWGLNDTYRFIWSYFGGSLRNKTPLPQNLRRVRAGQRLSASCFHASRLQQARGFHDYFVQAVPPSSQHPEQKEKQYVRIPLKSAKHHFGVHTSRGERGYNEDTWQAGIIDLPAFGDGRTHSPQKEPVVHDPDHPTNSVFFFGIYDGHGGDTCSKFLQKHLHDYLEATSKAFGLQPPPNPPKFITKSELLHMQSNLNDSWRHIVGGYFQRFKPDYDSSHDHLGQKVERPKPRNVHEEQPPTLENLLSYSFLRADLDFISGDGLASYLSQKRPPNTSDDAAPAIYDLQNALDDVNGSYTTPPIKSIKRSEVISFKGGSTCSAALISMPEGESPSIPFWHPQAEPTIMTAHIGDTRILVCDLAGQPYPLTTNHHPSLPSESKRLRRYAAAFVTDSFGEERFGVLANTRAFGDVKQKRLGVSAEPEICRLTVRNKGEFSFMVLMTDGISGTLSDQEVVDIVGDSRTPDEAAKALVDYACTVTKEGDNASAMVVRLGGWEKRAPGDHTRDLREYRRKEAEQVRSRRM